MLDAHRAMQDDRRAAVGASGAQALEDLHGHREEAAHALEAAKGAAREALSGLYGRLRGPRTLGEARELGSMLEAPRGHERGGGSDELV